MNICITSNIDWYNMLQFQHLHRQWFWGNTCMFLKRWLWGFTDACAINYGLVTQYGSILVPVMACCLGHQVIIWTIVDFPLVKFCWLRLRAISQRGPMPLFYMMSNYTFKRKHPQPMITVLMTITQICFSFIFYFWALIRICLFIVS